MAGKDRVELTSDIKAEILSLVSKYGTGNVQLIYALHEILLSQKMSCVCVGFTKHMYALNMRKHACHISQEPP